MSWSNFKGVVIKPSEQIKPRPRYSLTSDILSFRRCPRQYGFIMNRGYVPAHAVQLFYGTIIHEVLDRAHRHYKGLEDPTKKGKPDHNDIIRYFDEVENSLRARGIRALNQDLKEHALVLLKKFNDAEADNLYPRVKDTEHRLQGDRTTYIVEGVVDVLIDSESGDPSPDKVEIWDYKGAKRPEDGDDKDLKSYEYQMQVYAYLYKIRNGILPKKAVLYFMNELGPDHPDAAPTKKDLERAKYTVDLTEKSIEKAVKEFDETAVRIEECKNRNTWPAPAESIVRTMNDTCTICDLRWSCPPYLTINGGDRKKIIPSLSLIDRSSSKSGKR